MARSGCLRYRACPGRAGLWLRNHLLAKHVPGAEPKYVRHDLGAYRAGRLCRPPGEALNTADTTAGS